MRASDVRFGVIGTNEEIAGGSKFNASAEAQFQELLSVENAGFLK